MERIRRWLRARAAEALRSEDEDSIPEHVAIIMDGNRRYARSRGLEQRNGYERGFGKLTEVLEWCAMLGVKHVSVFAFSCANFERSHSEVSALMDLAESKLLELADDKSTAAHRLGIRVLVEGSLGQLPPRVQHACARAMEQTWPNSRGTLHVCMAYDGEADMHQASAAVENAFARNELDENDRTDSHLFSCCLWSADTPPVDLLIRTSGVTRLSGFLLWQSRNAHLAFLEPLWPEITFSDLLHALLSYKRSTQALDRLKKKQRRKHSETQEDSTNGKEEGQSCCASSNKLSEKAQVFLNRRRRDLEHWIESAALCSSSEELPSWPFSGELCTNQIHDVHAQSFNANGKTDEVGNISPSETQSAVGSY